MDPQKKVLIALLSLLGAPGVVAGNHSHLDGEHQPVNDMPGSGSHHGQAGDLANLGGNFTVPHFQANQPGQNSVLAQDGQFGPSVHTAEGIPRAQTDGFEFGQQLPARYSQGGQSWQDGGSQQGGQQPWSYYGYEGRLRQGSDLERGGQSSSAGSFPLSSQSWQASRPHQIGQSLPTVHYGNDGQPWQASTTQQGGQPSPTLHHGNGGRPWQTNDLEQDSQSWSTAYHSNGDQHWKDGYRGQGQPWSSTAYHQQQNNQPRQGNDHEQVSDPVVNRQSWFSWRQIRGNGPEREGQSWSTNYYNQPHQASHNGGFEQANQRWHGIDHQRVDPKKPNCAHTS